LEKEKARRSGLWLEGHHYNQKEVEDGCEDDRADDCFCVVTHGISSLKKDPGTVTARGQLLRQLGHCVDKFRLADLAKNVKLPGLPRAE
jgi:hypothetical protein